MKKSLNKYSRKELLSVKKREWSETSIYDSIILIPDRQNHDSGFSWITIVGVINWKPVEIAGYCDILDFGRLNSNLKTKGPAFDCLAKSKCIRIFPYDSNKIQVGISLSTIDIEVITDKP